LLRLLADFLLLNDHPIGLMLLLLIRLLLLLLTCMLHLLDLTGKVGCWRGETRVKTTDMCLSGQRVADMLA